MLERTVDFQRSKVMPKAAQQYWMVKSEPAAYSWDQLVKDGRAAWTGVRNYQARINLRAMRTGDLVLFYHSVVGKEIVGIAKVAATAYRDPTATEGEWDCVDLVPFKPLKRPVTLAEIKAMPSLQDIKLLRQSRLSVLPLLPGEFKAIVALGSALKS